MSPEIGNESRAILTARSITKNQSKTATPGNWGQAKDDLKNVQLK